MNPLEITALPASTKRALVDALNAARIPLILSEAPTTATEGRKGQFAIWVEAGETEPRYALCVKAEDNVYTWRAQDLIILQETAPTEALFSGLIWVRPSTAEIFVRNALNTGWNDSALNEPDAGLLRFDLEQGLDPAEAAMGRDNLQLSEVGLTRRILVHDQTARLALSTADATLTAVTQEDTGDTWTLKQVGDPAVSDDWILSASEPTGITDIILSASFQAVEYVLPLVAASKYPILIRNLSGTTQLIKAAVADASTQIVNLANDSACVFYPIPIAGAWRYNVMPSTNGILATYAQQAYSAAYAEFYAARLAAQIGVSTEAETVKDLVVEAPASKAWPENYQIVRNPAGNTGHNITLPGPAFGNVGPYVIFAEEAITVYCPIITPSFAALPPDYTPGLIPPYEQALVSGRAAIFVYDLNTDSWDIKQFKIRKNPYRAAVYDAGTFEGDVTLDRRLGGDRQRIELTGATQARVFMPPTDPWEGQELTVRLVNTIGANPSPRTLEFDANIIRPSLSITTWPHPLVDNGIYITKLQYVDGRWELLAFTGAY